MKNRTLSFNGDYELISLSEQHLKPLYNWTIEEKHFKKYTCRPLKNWIDEDKFDQLNYSMLRNESYSVSH